jgi:ice-binding like protein/Big-like domain-containing protein
MNSLKLSVLIALLSCVPACGRQLVEFKDGEGTDASTNGDSSVGIAPTVISTVAEDGATEVALSTSLSATFSKHMNPSTITSLTFTVNQGSNTVAGSVTLDGATNTATFLPATPLGADLVYTATITTGTSDADGLVLATDYIWSFSTVATNSPPRVVFTSPSNLATNLSVNVQPTATFNKAMDPATLTSLTFTLNQGVTPVLGAVRLEANNTATFSPAMALGLSQRYTATITTRAQDTAGRALAANETWSFTTGACSQAAVALRSAASFVVLAGSTVTSTGPTVITGDLGVSPGTAVTGFPPGTLVGVKHAGDPTAATAIADLTTAYNDAAGRTLCPITVAGNLGGQTLKPGLYKSTSSLAVSSGDLTLDAQGDGNAVFIFQMASTLTTTAGRKVILTNRAKAANVYWQVGTSATLGTTTAFQGTIMADQAITLNTGASLNGRALARIGAVNLDSNAVVKPAS